MVPQSTKPGAVAGLRVVRVPDNDLLSHGQSVLSSARRRFTVLFGMGRSGSGGLWSSGVGRSQQPADRSQHERPRHAGVIALDFRFRRPTGKGKGGIESYWRNTKSAQQQAWQPSSPPSVCCRLTSDYRYGVKPHGPLVPVSSTHYCASTPGLSTWWSATTLLGDQVPGNPHLQARFPLRCFQRLSLPYIATRRCDWRHNRYTSGTSTPVLSY